MQIMHWCGWLASVTTIIGMMPQVYKTFKVRSTHEISTLMLVNYLICSVAWVAYGTMQNDIAVASSNVISLLVAVILLLQKVYYEKHAC